jgi:N-acylneuraminate cytidylyltransferase
MILIKVTKTVIYGIAMPDIVAIIPARGKSKGVPRKNIRSFAGKPLIAYSIEVALKTEEIDRVIVSTEDNEIARVALSYGAEVIERPEELARDDTPTIDVVFNLLKKIGEENVSFIILLQPTSPLRTDEDVRGSMRLFLQKDCESVISVCEAEPSPYWSFRLEEGYLIPAFGKQHLETRRQDLPKIYVPNGAIFIAQPKSLHHYKGFYCKKSLPYSMPINRSIDIDTELDFKFAEFVWRQQIANNKDSR